VLLAVRKKKLWIGLGVVVLLALLVGLNFYRGSQETKVAVQYFEVKQEDIEESVLAGGKVEVVGKEEITARVNAMVQDVLVKEGDRVKAGQVLIKLDTAELARDLQREEANLALQRANLARTRAAARPQEVAQDRASLKQAETAYNNAKAKYDRSRTLYDQGAVAKEALEAAYAEYIAAETAYTSARQRLSLRLEGDTAENKRAAEAQVRQAEVAVDLAREQLARAEVKASMDGVVLSLAAEKGKHVTVGAGLAVIGDTGRLQVKADISESDSGRLAVGQPVKITAAALPEEEFAGEVTRVGAAAVTRTKNSGEQTEVRVTVSITKFNEKLKPGYTVDLTITTASKNKALVIPYEAVTEKNKRKEVFVVDKGRAVKKPVTTGMGNELYLTVEKGLKAGDKVVVNPPDKLKDGAAVKETPYEAAKPVNGRKGEE
jgi:HlyD family secretion protein